MTIKKSQVLLVESRKKSNRVIFIPRKQKYLSKKLSHQDTDRNHVILTNLIGGFGFSHQNGTGGIILGGHHVDGAFPTDFKLELRPYHCNVMCGFLMTRGMKNRACVPPKVQTWKNVSYEIQWGKIRNRQKQTHSFVQPPGLSMIPGFKFQKKIAETTGASPAKG